MCSVRPTRPAARQHGVPNPTIGQPAWHVSHISSLQLERLASAISCSSGSLCVGFGTEVGCGVLCISEGQVISSTDPPVGASAWQAVLIGAVVGPAGPTPILTGGTCTSTSLCVAIDGAGNVLTLTKPTGGPGQWHSAAVDPGGSFVDISFRSPSLCVAVDDDGNMVTSTKPTGGSRAWTLEHIDNADSVAGNGAQHNAISWPTRRLCVAVDNGGNVMSATNPAGGPRAGKLIHLSLASTLTRISCPSASRATAVCASTRPDLPRCGCGESLDSTSVRRPLGAVAPKRRARPREWH
jgi:hypothetical protein